MIRMMVDGTRFTTVRRMFTIIVISTRSSEAKLRRGPVRAVAGAREPTHHPNANAEENAAASAAVFPCTSGIAISRTSNSAGPMSRRAIWKEETKSRTSFVSFASLYRPTVCTTRSLTRRMKPAYEYFCVCSVAKRARSCSVTSGILAALARNFLPRVWRYAFDSLMRPGSTSSPAPLLCLCIGASPSAARVAAPFTGSR